jgi:sulfite exporter TauE/SafE
MLNGLMPCTILSAMWLYTLSSGSAINGASDMAAWSLGTVPLMLLLGTAGSLVPQKYAKCFIRLAYIITISLGIKMLIAGVRILP